MLTALHIRDFAIIEDVALNLASGLTVLTGETGAGKSILVDALEQVLGGRADAGLIRHGADRADITATFSVEGRPEAAAWLREQALDDEADECHLRRVIQADGRSRGFINGRPVPMQSLKDLGERLVEIHGQHEHQSLLNRARQLSLLDAYGGHEKELEAVANAARACRDLERALKELPGAGDQRDNQLEYLRHQVRELEELDLSEREVETLEAEQRRLAHARELMDGCQRAASELDGDADETIANRLARVRHELESLAAMDERLREPLDLLDSALIQVQEGSGALNHYLADLELDPDRLSRVEERLGTAHDLARKHNVSMEQLPGVLERLRAELADLEGADERRTELEASLAEAHRTYRQAAQRLSRRRRQSAAALEKAVSGLMASLGMQGGRLSVELTSDDQRISAGGTETAEMQVSVNPGQPPRPLRRVASGGELSRIALAIQVATVDSSGSRTLIFDEVDAGVGGAVAEIVGKELRRVGAAGQALCVTHLPQVAAQGHHHLHVSKAAAHGKTRTRVTELEHKSRTEEIARMLGGVKITDTTTAHAREMLERAADSGSRKVTEPPR